LNLARKLPKRSTLGNSLNSLGLLYLEQEDYFKATDYFNQSLQAYQSQHNQTEIAMVFSNLGVVFQRQNKYQQALDYFKKGEQKAKENLDNDVMIAAKQGIGAVYRAQGKYQAALEVLDSGLSMAKELDDKIRIAELLWRKAEVFYSIGDYEQTAVLAEESFKLAHQLRQSNLSCYAATLLGKAQLRQKKTDLAFQTLSKAIEQIEEMRDRIAGQEQELQLYFENKVDSYHALVDFLIDENRPLDALLYSERAKGRVLFDVMRKGRADITKTMTEKEKEEERRLNQLIVSLNNQMRQEQSKQSPDALRVEKIKEQLDSARLEHSSFQNLLYAAHPKLKAQRGQMPGLNLDSLLSLSQSSQTAFLAYQVSRERVYLFVLSRSDQRPEMALKVFTIPVNEAVLASRVRMLHDMIAGRRLTFAALSREIYDLLIKPAEQLIQGKTLLCFIPDGVLWDVPFQALMPKAGRYLTEGYSIHYAPSLSVLIEMARRRTPASTPASGSLLALGNPFVGSQTARQLQEQQRGEAFEPLPAAEMEVNKLADIFSQNRSKIFTGAYAEERVFKSLSPAFNTIHLATHGILDNRHPLYSYLLLSKRDDDPNEDGLLEAREIMNLDLRAELAVLSACETARGKIGSGEGVIGMSWAFFVAGCRTTIVSQWKVNSAGTSILMINFYKLLEESNADNRRTKAEALRLAALSLMKDRRYQHPYYWAGFVLIGSNE
jgi:CHAT domain-containing protein